MTHPTCEALAAEIVRLETALRNIRDMASAGRSHMRNGEALLSYISRVIGRGIQ